MSNESHVYEVAESNAPGMNEYDSIADADVTEGTGCETNATIIPNVSSTCAENDQTNRKYPFPPQGELS